MKRISFLLLAVVFLAGCTTYKFQQGDKAYKTGYVVLRNGFAIPEYTVGKDNLAPEDINLANERFKRRKAKVEYYYKETGDIKNSVIACLEYPATMFQLAFGQLWMPVRIVSEYRYNHNPKYRDKVDKKEAESDSFQQAAIDKIKGKLKDYIGKDLAWEQDKLGVVSSESVVGSSEPAVRSPESGVGSKETAVLSESSAIVKEPAAAEKQTIESLAIKPVIIAKPSKGVSPLTVHFYGTKSRSLQGRITTYSWDFGDGDTSRSPNPVNTFYSTSFGAKYFTVTLTVYDDKGNSATESTVIGVLNK